MLEMRNFLQKKINKKGFTLAELLVVVAIIAILVAVSIPIFTGKLNEAKKNTDLANVRAAKAAAVTAYLQGDVTLTGTGGSKTATMRYDAVNGKTTTAAANTLDPYGKDGDNDTKVIEVTITETTTGSGTSAKTEPTVNTAWVAGKPAS